jgi:serine/threonine protein kinase
MEELRPGAYGCVYRPAFRCNEQPMYPNEKYISKVMRKKTAKKELSNYRALNMPAIDADRRYYLGEPELCTLENPDAFLNIKKKCKIDAPFVVLNYLDGGDNLITVLKRRVNYVQILKAFENIFHAIVLMHANERYHLDIKLGNIVFDGKRCRLVDFGLSRTSGMRVSNLYLYGFLPPRYVYPYWPIELSQLTTSPPVLNLDFFNDYYDAMAFSMDNSYLIRRIPLKALAAIQPALNGMTSPERKKFIYERADVWGIGIALYDIYHLLPQSELKSRLQAFIDILLRISIFDRPNALDALTAYQTFLSGIDDEIGRV